MIKYMKWLFVIALLVRDVVMFFFYILESTHLLFITNYRLGNLYRDKENLVL